MVLIIQCMLLLYSESHRPGSAQVSVHIMRIYTSSGWYDNPSAKQPSAKQYSAVAQPYSVGFSSPLLGSSSILLRASSVKYTLRVADSRLVVIAAPAPCSVLMS